MFTNKVRKYPCFGDTLVKATSKNIGKIIKWIKGITPALGTNSEKAFTEAFDMLDNHHKKHGVNCHTSILFLTDGEANDPSDIIQKRNDKNAVIFSYTLGRNASDTIPKFSPPPPPRLFFVSCAHSLLCQFCARPFQRWNAPHFAKESGGTHGWDLHSSRRRRQ